MKQTAVKVSDTNKEQLEHFAANQISWQQVRNKTTVTATKEHLREADIKLDRGSPTVCARTLMRTDHRKV